MEKVENKKKYVFGDKGCDVGDDSDCIPVKNCAIPNINLDDCPHICVFGKSWCGKSNFISCLLLHHFVHTIPYNNIIIFSPTFDTDKSYQAVWWYLKN